MPAPALTRATEWVQHNTRWLRWVLLGILAVLVIVRSLKGGDMDAFLNASLRLRQGENPYMPPFWGDMHYVYGTFWAWVLMPFTWLPNAVFNGLWTAASLWMLWRLYRLWSALLPVRFQAIASDWRFGLVFWLLMGRFVFYNFVMIQLTIFLVWAVFESELLFRKKKILPGAALLGVAIAIKLLPLLMLPWLAARGRWWAVLATMAAIVLCLALPATTEGWERNQLLLASWADAANPTQGKFVFEVDASTHGLPSLVPALFHQLPGDKSPYRRHIMELGPEAAMLALRLVQGLCLLTLVLVVIRPFLRPKPGFELYELGVLCLLIPLLAPQQQKYAYFFAAPVVFGLLLLAWDDWPQRRFWPWFGVMAWFVGTFLSQDMLIGRPLNMITQYYKTITWAALLLIPAWVLSVKSEERRVKN